MNVAVSAESIQALTFSTCGQGVLPRHWVFPRFCISKANGLVGTLYVTVNFFLLNFDGSKVVLCKISEFIFALDINILSMLDDQNNDYYEFN